MVGTMKALGVPVNRVTMILNGQRGVSVGSHFGPENGVDLELPERDPAREPPSFE